MIGSDGGDGARRGRRTVAVCLDVDDQPAAAPPPTVPAPAPRGGRRCSPPLVLIAALVGGGLAVATAAKPSYPVPDLPGKSLADARRLGRPGDVEFVVAERDGGSGEDVAAGVILDQSPLPADELKEGGTIRVRVSKGPSRVTCPT